jgi:transcription elongation factor Elf1
MSDAKPQADFAVIRQRITMQRILEHYRITDLQQSGNEMRGRCPLHEQGKAPRSFTVNTSKNVFQCFFCKAKGNVIDFVAKKENCSLREAGLKIWQWFELGSPTNSPPAQDTPSGPREQRPPAVHETHEQRRVVFDCPDRCGGEISKRMTFYLTSGPAFGVHGKCSQCGNWGSVEIPLDQLFKDAPTNNAVQ